jgi:hypothetical protein
MRSRECANAECPYCFLGISLKGKRVGMCSMLKQFIEAGCPSRGNSDGDILKN